MCIECDTATPMEEVDGDPMCGNCDMNGADAYVTEVEVVTPCPGGECHSDYHHYGTGMHHTPAEEV